MTRHGVHWYVAILLYTHYQSHRKKDKKNLYLDGIAAFVSSLKDQPIEAAWYLPHGDTSGYCKEDEAVNPGCLRGKRWDFGWILCHKSVSIPCRIDCPSLLNHRLHHAWSNQLKTHIRVNNGAEKQSLHPTIPKERPKLPNSQEQIIPHFVSFSYLYLWVCGYSQLQRKLHIRNATSIYVDRLGTNLQVSESLGGSDSSSMIWSELTSKTLQFLQTIWQQDRGAANENFKNPATNRAHLEHRIRNDHLAT